MTREDAETLFDLMELYREEHPNCTDDEAFEAVIWGHSKFQPTPANRHYNDQTQNIHR